MIDTQAEKYFMEKSEQFPDIIYLAKVDDAEVERIQCRIEGTLFKRAGAGFGYESLLRPHCAYPTLELAHASLYNDLVYKIEDLYHQRESLISKLRLYEESMLHQMAMEASREARKSNG